MNKIQRLRIKAFNTQQGRCFYCDQPMWIKSPSELVQYGLKQRTAKALRCTAEHLTARQDGGRDVEGNIAAACWFCNMHRHKRKSPPTPKNFQDFVMNRIKNGKWHLIRIAQ